MPIARLSRDILRQVAETKVQEAKVLLDNKHWNGAYAAAGFAIECALKAVLANAVKQYDFPDKRFVLDMYQHDLKALIKLDVALWTAFSGEAAQNQDLADNWNTVKDWNVERRYEIVAEQEAKDMYEAVAEPGVGLLDWIKGKW